MNSRKKQKWTQEKNKKIQTTHVSLMLGRCVTNAWEMTRFQRGHLMFKIPPGRDLFCGVKFCWLCPGQRLRNRTSSASSFRSTPSMKLKLCVHRAPIPNPSPKHLCSRSCFGLRLWRGSSTRMLPVDWGGRCKFCQGAAGRWQKQACLRTLVSKCYRHHCVVWGLKF